MTDSKFNRFEEVKFSSDTGVRVEGDFEPEFFFPDFAGWDAVRESVVDVDEDKAKEVVAFFAKVFGWEVEVKKAK